MISFVKKKKKKQKKTENGGFFDWRHRRSANGSTSVSARFIGWWKFDLLIRPLWATVLNNVEFHFNCNFIPMPCVLVFFVLVVVVFFYVVRFFPPRVISRSLSLFVSIIFQLSCIFHFKSERLFKTSQDTRRLRTWTSTFGRFCFAIESRSSSIFKWMSVSCNLVYISQWLVCASHLALIWIAQFAYLLLISISSSRRLPDDQLTRWRNFYGNIQAVGSTEPPWQSRISQIVD